MDPVPTVQEAGWAPGPVWMGAENLAPLGFDPWIHPVASHYTNSVSYIYIYKKPYITEILETVVYRQNTFTLMHIMNPAQPQQSSQNRAISSGI